MFPLYTLWKHQKTFGSKGINLKWDHWSEIRSFVQEPNSFKQEVFSNLLSKARF